MADSPVNNVEQLVDHPHRFERLVSQTLDTGMTLVTTYGIRTIGAVLILLVGWFVARQVQRGMVRVGRKSDRVDLTIAAFLGSLAKYLIIAFTLIAVMASFGVETTSVVAVLGAAGIAIGLALQGTLSNVAAGFMLIIFRPFRVGDAVETASVAGTVTEVSLFTTELRSADNVRIILPNNAVWAGVTKNLSSSRTRRTELEVPIPYGVDSAAALKLMGDIVQGDTRVLKDPAPVLGVSKMGDVNARLIAQVWTNTADAAATQLALNTAFRDQLGRAGYLKI